MDTSEYMPMFLAEAHGHLQELGLAVVALEADPSNRGTVDGIFRLAHSIKGMSATMGFVAIPELTHAMEDVFELLRQRTGGLSHDAITTVLACLDALEAGFESIESDGEERLDPEPLIAQLRCLTRERALDGERTGTAPGLAPGQSLRGRAPRDAPAPAHASARTVRVEADRLDTLMHLMGDLVRDLSAKLGKSVELELVGRDTELDGTVVDSLGDPLVHLVRNSLDHGIEPPDVRLAAGKPATGTLTIAARHAGGSVIVEVRDDGRGIDPDSVGLKALQRGLIDAATADAIDMQAAIELLFAPGFSTSEVISEISGRGVGMDAARAKIRGLGGELLIESIPGRGTSAQIRLPLTGARSRVELAGVA